MQNKLTFGKQQGKTVSELVFTQPGYISWILDDLDCIVCKPNVIQMIKILKLSLFAAFISLSLATSAQTLFKSEEFVGCGLVQSVRPINQAPIVNDTAYSLFKGGANAGEVGMVLQGLGIGGFLFAAAASMGTGLAIDAAKDAPKVPTSVLPGKDGNFKNVVALSMKMDNGETINVPFINRRGRDYKAGDVLVLSFSKLNQSLQTYMFSIDKGGQKYRDMYCVSKDYTKEQADEILRANANLVDESKIIVQ